jgi:uncharacterized sulfatase
MKRSVKNITVAAALAQMTGAASAKDAQPNILVIYTDDHGYADLSCQGVCTDVQTPNLDRLALGGVRMTDGHSTAPQCVPSRCGLMTGQYQNKLGVESNEQFKQPGGLDGFNKALTIAERLKAAGYATGMAGKWHLGPEKEIVSHGFDQVFYKHSSRPGYANFNLEGRDVPAGPENTELYHLDACSAAACAFIKRYQDKPFFFYLAYRAPHVPLDPPEKYLSRFKGPMPECRRRALAMLSAVDDGVGQIVQTLRDLKLEEKTLIFVIGDNGAPLKISKPDKPDDIGWDGSLNDPMNGEKGMLTEGGMRVPFLVYWKGVIPGGQVYTNPVISLDVAASAVALAGLPQDPVLDGVNLIPYLTGQKTGVPHEALYWRWSGQSAIRKGPWKYLNAGNREYLFDMTNDFQEKHNLIAQKPELARELRTQLQTWGETLQPPGLDTQKISTQAQEYFDYYLDGKSVTPAPVTGGAGLFKARDVNLDGKVSQEEFTGNAAGRNVPELKKRFEALDKNGNGFWERSEITK